MTRFSARMERIREDLIRRAQMRRQTNADDDAAATADADAMERGQQQQTQPEMTQLPPNETYTTRLAAMFSAPAAIFNRNVQQQQESDTASNPTVESPKSPRPDSEWPTVHRNNQSQPDHASNPDYPGQPQPAVLPVDSDGSNPDPEANTTQPSSGRRRRRKRSKTVVEPKRFLFCFPWPASPRVRSSAVYCFTSGLFLVLLLAVCKCPPHFTPPLSTHQTLTLTRRPRPLHDTTHSQGRADNHASPRHPLLHRLLLLQHRPPLYSASPRRPVPPRPPATPARLQRRLCHAAAPDTCCSCPG